MKTEGKSATSTYRLKTNNIYCNTWTSCCNW